jgi:type IV pilus assembly protein PilB
MKEDILSSEILRTTLLEYGLLSEDQLTVASERADLEETTLRDAILWHNFLSDEELGKIVAEHFHVTFVRLKEKSIPEDVLHIIPEIVAKKNHAIIFSVESESISLATSHPENLQFFNFLERKEGRAVRVHFATDRDISEALGQYRKGATEAFEEILRENLEEATKNMGESVDPPIIRIVNTMVAYADRNKASDIHIEPRDHDALIRFRIDGVLHDIAKLPKELHPQIISRIKVLSGLRTDEHHAPQDGKLQVTLDEEQLDVRVSIIPITNGEKAVLRLLSDQSRQFSLSNLGIGTEDLLKIQDSYQRPYGMVLVTGPTGCGKTTTLYSFLKLLNRRNVNIMTIEDPVEYDVEGINQIQVNPEANLTFATGLRSILRQDPNIILVGEIRDAETAGIAINLAMTGHLVLSTIHTNNASTTIPRLLDLGVEPFLITSTVNAIIAERLVRKIHESCRVSKEIPLRELFEKIDRKSVEMVFGSTDPDALIRVYFGKGCPACHETGFRGRTGIFEVFTFNDILRKAIIDERNSNEIEELARSFGMKTMLEDGLVKVKNGMTTMEEVIRVSRE